GGILGSGALNSVGASEGSWVASISGSECATRIVAGKGRGPLGSSVTRFCCGTATGLGVSGRRLTLSDGSPRPGMKAVTTVCGRMRGSPGGPDEGGEGSGGEGSGGEGSIASRCGVVWSEGETRIDPGGGGGCRA